MEAPRPLTHDELKASEAAFRGLPFNPTWSHAARVVYDGILATLAKTSELSCPSMSDMPPETPLESSPTPETAEPDATPSLPVTFGMVDHESAPQTTSTAKTVRSRREAIEAGYLTDVSTIANKVGLDLAVGMTKPLWTQGICVSDDLSKDDVEGRVRDVLLAVRLRLAGLEAPAAFVEVPVLLTFPPEPTPQIFPIFALFHKDPLEEDSLLLIHPGEVTIAKESVSEN